MSPPRLNPDPPTEQPPGDPDETQPDRKHRLVNISRTPGRPRLTLRGPAGLLVIVPWFIGMWIIAKGLRHLLG